MKRSIVKQGAATLMVSLPSKWARRFRLEKGNEIDIVEKGRELIIRPGFVSEIRKTKINISELKHLWRRVVSALYKAGYDEIEIDFNKPDEITKVYSVLQEFIGFEIISQAEKSCLIKEIVESKETNFNAIFSRTFGMLLSIAEDCSNALKKRNTELLGTIPERDIIINKYANFCRRIINKGLVDQKDAPMLYYLIEELETMGDVYKDFAKYLFETKNIPNEKVIKSLDNVNLLIADLSLIASRFGKEKIIDFTERWRKSRDIVNEMFRTKSIAETRALNYISEILQQLQNMVGPILTINAENL